MKNKPSLGNNVRLAMEHPKLPRKQYLSIYFPKKHLQNTLQASSSIYRAFASSNPSILLVLSIFIFTQYEFFFLFFLPFFFPRRTFPILRVAACHAGLYFYFRPEFPPSARGKITINHFPKFYPPRGYTHPRSPFSRPFFCHKKSIRSGRGCV